MCVQYPVDEDSVTLMTVEGRLSENSLFSFPMYFLFFPCLSRLPVMSMTAKLRIPSCEDPVHRRTCSLESPVRLIWLFLLTCD